MRELDAARLAAMKETENKVTSTDDEDSDDKEQNQETDSNEEEEKQNIDEDEEELPQKLRSVGAYNRRGWGMGQSIWGARAKP